MSYILIPHPAPRTVVDRGPDDNANALRIRSDMSSDGLAHTVSVNMHILYFYGPDGHWPPDTR
eukprot:scaffold33152_cov143-Isochrysis_galbana.AAC.2